MKNLDSVYDLQWNPRIVVEASAGTGKTYTIVGIFIRLLLEKELTVDQILVMTFTKKATSELRDRILSRLRECLHLLESGKGSEDTFLSAFLNWVGTQDRDAVEARIKEAIRNFDDSRVFTIHGFCQKVLNEEALTAGVPFDLEVTPHDDLLLQAAEDFWRNFMHRHSAAESGRLYINKLQDVAKSPQELIGNKGIGNVINRQGAVIEGEIIRDPESYLESVLTLRKEMAGLWESDKSDILAILNHCDISRYTTHLRTRLNKLRTFLNDSSYSEDTPQSLKFFTSDYLYDEQNLKKNGSPTRPHPFFELCTRFSDLTERLPQIKTTLIKEACTNILERREELSINSKAITYDDLLIKLQKALSNPNNGEALASKLLRSYPYALVDEFQDTDSIQYSIFNSIYPKSGDKSSLMMIGDPKQAIYAFRGADIYTYFRAKKEGDPETWSLKKNFRSTPKLIGAINNLFQSKERQSFIESEIEFFESDVGRPGSVNEYLVDGKPPVPFQITTLPGVSGSKGEVKDFAFDETVRQVADLLEHKSIMLRESEGKPERRLEAGDIAILVTGHRDAADIKHRLKEVRVDAVTYSQEKVFDSFEAKRLRYVMEAILEPMNRRSVNQALLSGLFGSRLNRLYELKDDETLRQELTEELLQLQDRWSRHGFMVMFRSLLHKKGRLAEIAELRNSERILTNLHQLAELCSSVELDSKMDPNTLHSWYLRELKNPGKDDEQTLLLESDQNLVKISTIHGSKGLEFPVVICPTLWMGRDPKKNDFLGYHKPDSEQLTINVDQIETVNRVEAENLSAVESIAEEVRKTYVALTRAKYECRVIWSAHNLSHLSGLGASILGRDNLIQNFGNKIKEGDEDLSDDTFLDHFKKLSVQNPDRIRLDILENPVQRKAKVQWSRAGGEQLTVKTYNGRMNLPVQKRVESFSSLAGHKTDAIEPDYDQITDWYADALSQPSGQIPERNIFTFPKGATAGTAIHKLFEQEEFDFDTAESKDLSGMITEVLEEYRIDSEWMPVMQTMIHHILAADYRGLDLRRVNSHDHLREMDFYFPIAKPDSSSLLQIIRSENVNATHPDKARNYLTGFIDLIVRQNGKYYILDYKSNYLGDNLDDYSNEKLSQEISSAGYDLQYHLYTVALVRHLKQTLPDFNYEEQFGGVMYLFVRGMRAGSDNGIWFHKPDEKVITQLDEQLRR